MSKTNVRKVKSNHYNLANQRDYESFHHAKDEDDGGPQVEIEEKLDNFLKHDSPSLISVGQDPVFTSGNEWWVAKHNNLLYPTELSKSYQDDALTHEQYSNDGPCGAFVACSKRVKELLPNYKNILLVNADDSGDFGDITELMPNYSLAGQFTGLPLVSFSCIHQMIDGEVENTKEILGSGQFVLLDFCPEQKKDLTAAQREQLKKAKRKYADHRSPPANYGLTPPQRGFSLIQPGGMNGKYQWHRTGTTLFHWGGVINAYYLFAQDEGTYFGCELVGPAKTIAEAFEQLIPKEIRKRTDLVRQGEWFATPVKEQEIPALQDCILMGQSVDEGVFLPILTDEDNHHAIQCAEMRVSKDGVLYAKDATLSHDEHAEVFVSGWVRYYRNTAKRSISQEGVD